MTEELTLRVTDLERKAIAFCREKDVPFPIANYLVDFAEEVTKDLQENNKQLEELIAEQYPDLKQSLDWADEREKELQAENAELKHTIAELRRDKDNLNTHTKAQEKLSEYRSNQLTKAKEVINDLVHLGEFNEHTDEEYFNYQVHEVLKNAEQFIKE